MRPPRGRLLALALAGCGSDPSKSASGGSGSSIDTAAAEAPCQEQRWYEDVDGDGYGNPYAMVEDCTAPAGHVSDFADCDDTDADAHPGQVWHADLDGDGFGDPTAPHARCSRPLGHVPNADDCDDADATRNPSTEWFLDSDRDRFGDPTAPVASCEATDSHAPNADDCDDTDPFIHPDRAEVCDAIDNDCDGLIDDDDTDVDPYTRVLFYRDEDGDDFGTEEELGEFCASTDPGARQPGDCDDLDATVNPGELELPDRIDQNCDGESTLHYLRNTAEGLTSPAFTEGTLLSAVAGDLDGDGLPELMVGEARGSEAAGQLVVFGGSLPRDLTDSTPGSWHWTGPVDGDLLGASAPAIVGDMDGDGLSDLLVSAPGAESGAGVAYLLGGTAASGDIDDAASWSWVGSDTSAAIGTPVALGDIDADGLGDALLANPLYDSDRSDQGRVWLLLSGSVGVSSVPTEVDALPEGTGSVRFGTSPVNVGDTDGDGIDELLLGAPRATQEATLDGIVYRLPVTELADPAFSVDTADRYYGLDSFAQLGNTNRAIGDFSGDGYADLLLSSTDALTGYGSGTAYLFFGATTAAPATRADGADARIGNDLGPNTLAGDDQWGDWVGVGDLNGDGADDLLVGAPGADLSRNYGNDGLAAAFLGGPLTGDHGTFASADVLFHGVSQYGTRPLVGAGDVDGDGLADIWVGHHHTELTLRFLPGAGFPSP